MVIHWHFRSFYGIKYDNFMLPSGQYTNAVYGFFNAFIDAYKEGKSYKYLAVALIFKNFQKRRI